jgi:hypothetical protein
LTAATTGTTSTSGGDVIQLLFLVADRRTK